VSSGMVDSPISFALTVVLPSPFRSRSVRRAQHRSCAQAVTSVRADAALRRAATSSCRRRGIGGLGHLALQFAHAMGCEVTAFSTNPEKRRRSRLWRRSFCNEPRPVANAKRCPDPRFHTIDGHCPAPWTAYVEALRPNGTLTSVQSTVLRSGSGGRQRTCFASRCRPKIDRRERNRRESGHARDAQFAARQRHRRKNRGILLCRHKTALCNVCATTPHAIESCRDQTYPKVLIETRRLPRSKMKLNKFSRSSLLLRYARISDASPPPRVLVESKRRI